MPDEPMLHTGRLRDNEIRILELFPGDLESSISCSLRRALLDDKPVYNALSYVWGDANDSRQITVDNEAISVTANLESALRHLRSARQPISLWVDAVCINQKDFEERNAQVRIMGTLYGAAKRVCIWIGVADELSDAAFLSMPSIADGQVDDQARHGTFGFYLSLGTRAWFSRIWIIQELALATTDPVVMCGMQHIPWSTFMSAWKVLSKHFFSEIGMVRRSPDGQNDEFLGKIKIDLLDETRSIVRRDKGQSLKQLLMLARTSECTDPKDRIFGLLGMLNEEERNGFPLIDYRKPVATIYNEAMAHLFSHGQGPAFLGDTWMSGIKPHIQDLPSWSLDFSRQTSEKVDNVLNNRFRAPFPQSVSGVGAEAVNGVVLADQITLRVEALPVDFIDEIIHLPADFRECLLLLHNIQDLAEKARIKPIRCDERASRLMTTFKQSEPLWRTLISNVAHLLGNDVAPDQYGALFADLLEYSTQLVNRQAPSTDIPYPNNDFVNILKVYLPHRAFITTTNGFVGMANSDVLPQDEISIWFGAAVPFVTRPMADDTYCQLISGAYVGGIMSGAMVDELYCEDLLDSKTLLVR